MQSPYYVNYEHCHSKHDMKTYIILFLTFVLLLSGCSLINKEPDVVIGELGAATLLPDGTTAVITCSDRCEKKSQCGTTRGEKVIMGGLDTTVVSSWNMMLTDKTAVIINTSQSRTVQKVKYPEQEENLYFYKVTANNDSGTSGWIAGWCVATTTQPEPPVE